MTAPPRGENAVKFSLEVVATGTFPPYNESRSDANELATRWAHREGVQAGDQRIVPYHGKWYLIEAFDDSTLGYQIVRPLTASQYKQYSEGKSNGIINGQSVLEDADELGELDSEGKWDGGRRLHSAPLSFGQRGENLVVREMGSQQTGERASGSQKLGDHKSGGENQQGIGAVTFLKDQTFDGDHVHKATSIHTRTNPMGMMEQLESDATVYVRKNKLDVVPGSSLLKSGTLNASIKFIDDILSQDDKAVKQERSLRGAKDAAALRAERNTR